LFIISNLLRAMLFNRLGAAFGVIYGNRYVDFNRLTFQDQFTGSGFNTNLPTGESALTDMKPYFSGSFGLVYSVTTDKYNLDIGASLFISISRSKPF
jgi:hypothetical protein